MGSGSNAGTVQILPRGQHERPARAISLVGQEWRILTTIIVISDVVCYYLSFRAAFWARYVANIPLFHFLTPPVIDYTQFSLLTIPVLLLLFAGIGLYNRKNLLGDIREYSLVFNGTTLGMFLNVSIGFLFPDDLVLARGWVILTWIFSFLSISTGRFLIRRAVYRLRHEGLFQSPAIIVGANAEAGLVADQLMNAKTSGLRIIGFVQCSDCISRLHESLSCLGNLDDLASIIQRNRASVVILISSALTREQILDVFRKFGTAKDIDLRMSTGLYEIITTGLQVKEDGMVPLVVINKVRLTGTDEVLKTILDYCIAIPAALLFIPFFLIIALLIKLDSPGPVIYLRRVMGVNGKQFNAYKFRTMRVDGDQILAAHPELLEEYKSRFKLNNDPRVTRLGRFLRKTSIDELPQIFNVLKNEMSIVGPRMICPEELEKYNQWDINLLTVKPGLTGLWQVRGRSDVSYDGRVRYDMYYIRNWTIWLDLQIILQTIPVVIFRRGAY